MDRFQAQESEWLWLWEYWHCQDIQDEFVKFKVKTSSRLMLLTTTLLISSLFITYWSLVLPIYNNKLDISTMFLCLMLFVIPLWILTICRYILDQDSMSTEQISQIKPLEIWIIFGFTIGSGLTMLMRFLNGQCPSFQLQETLGCLPFHSGLDIPGENVAITLLMPLYFSMLLPTISGLVSLSSFGLAVLIILGPSVYFNATRSASLIICLCVLAAIKNYIYLKQRANLFVYTRNYKLVMAQSEHDRQISTERFLTEVRNFLSGVSHDLKTVCQPTNVDL
jgi:hypothetical protein